MWMSQEETTDPTTSDGLGRLLIRPRMRIVGTQAAVAVILFACIPGGLWLAGTLFSPGASRALLWFGGLCLGGWAVAQVFWFRRNAPRAIVATDEFLGIIAHTGDQHRIVWSSIFSAVHSTEKLGMQWRLETLSSGTVVLRDIGIDSERWGLLRAAIVERVGRNGSVLVDPLSEGIYGD
jgi:hypothetical protein